MSSRCNSNGVCGGRDAIVTDRNCSRCSCGNRDSDNDILGSFDRNNGNSRNNRDNRDNRDDRDDCGCNQSVFHCAACGLTATIFRIVRGLDNALSNNCGCRRDSDRDSDCDCDYD